MKQNEQIESESETESKSKAESETDIESDRCFALLPLKGVFFFCQSLLKRVGGEG